MSSRCRTILHAINGSFAQFDMLSTMSANRLDLFGRYLGSLSPFENHILIPFRVRGPHRDRELGERGGIHSLLIPAPFICRAAGQVHPQTLPERLPNAGCGVS